MTHEIDLSILDDVLQERVRQQQKWGPQHHSDLRWNAILGEERGEVEREICSHLESTASTPGHERYVERLRAELVQVAAVACAWIEDLDHGEA